MEDMDMLTCRRQRDVSSSLQVTSTLQPDVLGNKLRKVPHALGPSQRNLKATRSGWRIC